MEQAFHGNYKLYIGVHQAGTGCSYEFKFLMIIAQKVKQMKSS